MITLITGLPGSGKSLFTLKTVKELADREKRPVFYHGIPDLTLTDWQLMEKGEDWVNCPEGAIIVIDECQTTFRPRANGAPVPQHVQQLEVHRHKGHDLYVITQHPMLLDGNLRRLVGRHYHVVRFFGFQKSTIHEFQKVRDNVDKSTKGGTSRVFNFPKEVYGWYKSADMHTVKRRIPPALIAVIVLPLLVCVAGYILYRSIDGLSEAPEAVKAVGAGGVQEGAPVMQAARQQQPELSYFELRAERVQGLPHTAPVYDEVTQPVEAPLPSACVEFRGVCKCYSQQGTEMTVQPEMCRHIVQKGFFVDFANGSALQTARRPDDYQRRDFERAASEAPAGGEKVGPAPVGVPVHQGASPSDQEVRSPSKIARERMAASPYAFTPPSN